MSIQIIHIVLYSHEGKQRVVNLKPGEVNVITGASGTGKSAIIEIVDYCMGSSNCRVPDGKIRNTVSWFGIGLKLTDGYAFIARKCPARRSDSSEECYVEVGASAVIPDFDSIHQNTNSNGLTKTLSGWTGIGENIHRPPDGQTRDPLAATVRHALMLCFQPQDEIIRRDQLFHGAGDHWKAQSLKDTLPYLLGAVDEDYVRNQETLKRLKKALKTEASKLLEIETLRGDGIGKAATLLTQARSVGLTTSPNSENWEDLVATLYTISRLPISKIEAPDSGSMEYEKLLEERQKLLDQRRYIDNQITAVQSLENAESGYSTEANEQKARLISIGIFEQHVEGTCPICSGCLSENTTVPYPSEIHKSLVHLSSQLEQVSRNTPHIEKALAELEGQYQGINDKLSQNRASLKAIQQADKRLRQLRDDASRKALILGRISLYLESLPDYPDTSALIEKVEALKSKIKSLEEKLSRDTIQERLNSIVAILSKGMTERAAHLELEHSDNMLRFNLNKLTLVAETPDGPIPMERMGSGENWVGYHLIGHLALHEWFVKYNRPVPRFLFIDQPSQVYFPPEPAKDRSIDDLGDDDRQELRRMLRMLYEAVKQLSPNFQIIITEHADIDEDWYQDSIRERWRGGPKLVPEDWPSYSDMNL